MTPVVKPRPSLEPLDRRPQARTIRVEDLLGEVSRGRVRVPSFQRGLKWNLKDARDLLDSIYRGYPIGTLLLWEKPAEAAELRFGALTVSAPARPDAWWVVDGQQRIVSLARVLLAEHPSGDDFALVFDLDQTGFVSAASTGRLIATDPSRWLPVEVTLDSERLFNWLLAQTASTPQRRERAVRVGKQIREYDITAYVVHTDSDETLREIFSRVNSTGRPLDAGEVFDALHGARSAGVPTNFDGIVQELSTLGFGRVETKTLYRLLRVLAGVDVTGRGGDNVLRLADGTAGAAYAETAAAARRAIQFFKSDAGIPHYDLLPYKQPLVTLGKFFHLHPAPSARSRQLLIRWIWRGALSGHHRGDIATTRRTLEQIDRDEEPSVQRLLKLLPGVAPFWPSAAERFNFRYAGGKLQALALIALAPRDLQNGAVLKPAEIFDRRRDADDDIPICDVLTNASGDLRSSVANRVIQPRRPGLRRLLAATADPAVLASHVIDSLVRDALVGGNDKAFLTLRAQALDRHFERFFSGQARWSDSDRPSISLLAAAEEESP